MTTTTLTVRRAGRGTGARRPGVNCSTRLSLVRRAFLSITHRCAVLVVVVVVRASSLSSTIRNNNNNKKKLFTILARTSVFIPVRVQSRFSRLVIYSFFFLPVYVVLDDRVSIVFTYTHTRTVPYEKQRNASVIVRRRPSAAPYWKRRRHRTDSSALHRRSSVFRIVLLVFPVHRCCSSAPFRFVHAHSSHHLWTFCETRPVSIYFPHVSSSQAIAPSRWEVWDTRPAAESGDRFIVSVTSV